MSLISDDDEHSLAAFAAATDVNQFASVHAVTVEHGITQSFSKGKFNGLLLSENTPGSRYPHWGRKWRLRQRSWGAWLLWCNKRPFGLI